MYWSYRSIPEIKSLPRKQQDELWKRNCYRQWRHWEGWLGILPLFFLVAVGSRFFGLSGELVGAVVGSMINFQVTVEFARRGIRHGIDR